MIKVETGNSVSFLLKQVDKNSSYVAGLSDFTTTIRIGLKDFCVPMRTDSGIYQSSQRYEAMSDEEIVAHIIARDKLAAAYLLIVRCGSRLSFLAKVKFRTLGLEFDDVVSELFIHLQKNDWKALRDFRGQSKSGRSCKLDNYISLIASRLLWKKMKRAVKDIDWIIPLYQVEARLIPDESVERHQLVESVIEAIMSLENAGEREVLLLYKIEGRTVQEVAEILKISTGNVYTRCSRALKNLRILLEEEGVYV